MEGNKGTSATRAKQKYNTANYDRLYPYVPKGRKSVYEEAAKSAGISLNDYVVRALDEKIDRDSKEQEE